MRRAAISASVSAPPSSLTRNRKKHTAFPGERKGCPISNAKVCVENGTPSAGNASHVCRNVNCVSGRFLAFQVV